MAYTTKYRIQYSRIESGSTTTIDILEDNFSGSIINLQPASNPLEISFEGKSENIFESTKGSGATIKVLATPLTLTSLFTTEPQQYMVKIYNGNSGDTLIWQGFVNTGIYNESYSRPATLNTSEITIQCNDGMKILDDIYYMQSDTSPFTGIDTLGNILKNAVNTLALSFTNIYTSVDIRLPNNATNIFTGVKVNNENYYDENIVPMSCRQVLDSMFGGLGLSVFFNGDNIYIIDPICLHSTSNGRVYAYTNFTEGASSFGGYLDISNDDIAWYSSGSTLDVINIINQIEFKYDPYTLTTFKYDFNDNLTSAGSWAYPEDTTIYPPAYNNAPVFKDWTTSGGTHFIGVAESSTADREYGIYLLGGTGINETITYTIPYSTITQDDNVLLQVNVDSYANTKVNGPNIYSALPAQNEYYTYSFQYSIKIGDQYWKEDRWEAGETGNYKLLLWARDWAVSDAEYYNDHTKSQVANTWVTMRSTIPIPLSSSLTGGMIEFIIYDHVSDIMVNGKHTDIPSGTTFYPIWTFFLKNFKIDFIDVTTRKSIENKGVLLKGTNNVNPLYKIDPITINLTSGIGTHGNSRGAYRDTNAAILSGFRRSSPLTVYDSMELLSQSMITQYQQPRFKISGILRAEDYLLNLRLKLIQDTDYMSSRGFYIVSGTYNDRREYMNVDMVECTSTRDSIS